MKLRRKTAWRKGVGKRMKTIGVLSFQGSVEEHLCALKQLGKEDDRIKAVTVNTPETIEQVDGLILPGGESTTISRLLKIFNLEEPLRKRIQKGMPVWGTCAGMILLAKEIIGEAPHLGTMDITVRRNAYGAQIDSFRIDTTIPELGEPPYPLVFIRAPWIETAENSVKTLCAVDNHIVAARQDNMLVTSFHPELTEDFRFHRYFAEMI